MKNISMRWRDQMYSGVWQATHTHTSKHIWKQMSCFICTLFATVQNNKRKQAQTFNRWMENLWLMHDRNLCTEQKKNVDPVRIEPHGIPFQRPCVRPIRIVNTDWDRGTGFEFMHSDRGSLFNFLAARKIKLFLLFSPLLQLQNGLINVISVCGESTLCIFCSKNERRKCQQQNEKKTACKHKRIHITC